MPTSELTAADRIAAAAARLKETNAPRTVRLHDEVDELLGLQLALERLAVAADGLGIARRRIAELASELDDVRRAA